jgi:hypothetical protein
MNRFYRVHEPPDILCKTLFWYIFLGEEVISFWILIGMLNILKITSSYAILVLRIICRVVIEQ